MNKCWMLDTGCSILDVRYWMLDVGYWMLDTRCSMVMADSKITKKRAVL